MATVTGNLSDFAGAVLTGLQPVVEFIPSGNAVFGAALLSTKPVKVVPGSSGAFTVSLVPNLQTRPLTFYSIRLSWLDSASNYVSQDFPDFMLRVPPEGGQVKDLLVTAVSPYMVWKGSVEPPAGNNLFWFNPVTGAMYRRKNV